MKQKIKPITVDEFMATLDHPFKSEVESVRRILLKANDQITEQIKWNAPSFCFGGDDRITFRLHPAKDIQLIFHRGAKVRTDVDNFSFEDSASLIKWITKDRGTVTFKNKAEIEARQDDLIILVDKWMKATID